MDTSHIPNTFWHAISVSIIALTFGFLVIAYRSTTISVEIANTKIALTRAASEVDKAASVLKVEAKAVEEAQRAVLFSSIKAQSGDTQGPLECDEFSGEDKLLCERLETIEKVQIEVEKAVQLVNKVGVLF